jgi:hypothetical protein
VSRLPENLYFSLSEVEEHKTATGGHDNYHEFPIICLKSL